MKDIPLPSFYPLSVETQQRNLSGINLNPRIKLNTLNQRNKAWPKTCALYAKIPIRKKQG